MWNRLSTASSRICLPRRNLPKLGHPAIVGLMIPAQSPPGAHALRRYRLTWLEEQGCPRGLEAFWMGHSSGDVRGRYDKTAEDREFRHRQVDRIGTRDFLGIPSAVTGCLRIDTLLSHSF